MTEENDETRAGERGRLSRLSSGVIDRLQLAADALPGGRRADEEVVEVGFAGPGTVEVDLRETGDEPAGGEDGGSTSAGGDAGDPGGSVELSRPGSAMSPTVDPDDYERGTFVFPSHDEGFVRSVELRGNNGARRDAETVYLLTGETYTVPTELVALDDPAIYEASTESSVRAKLDAIVEELKLAHEGRPDPKLIAYVHTHPDGSTRPSPTDRQNGERIAERFERQFDDVEFFHGIHGLGERTTVEGDRRRDLRSSTGGCWWYGENRRHELAIFDASYNSRRVVVP